MSRRHRIRVEGGLDLAIQELGGRGPAVVLLHGILGSGSSWLPVARWLAASHRVLIPDLAGFGQSSRSSDPDTLHARSQAGLLLEALDVLRVIGAVLVGHDFGGPVALSFLARAPGRVAGVGLLSTNAFPDTSIPFPLSATIWPVVGGAARKALFSPPSLRMMLRRGVGRPRIEIDPDTAVGANGGQGTRSARTATISRRS